VPRLRRFRREERIGLPAGGDLAGFLSAALGTHRRGFLALDARAAPFAAASRAVAAALPPWLRRNPFASVDVLLRARGPEDLDALEGLVVAIQAEESTLGAPLHRRAWTFLDRGARARAGEAWLDGAGALSILRTGRGAGVPAA
jgi:hypothetical protein